MNVRHIVVSAPCAGHRQHKADGCALAHDRHADDEVRVLIDVAECGAHGVGVIAHRALGHVLRHGQHAVDESCIGRQQQVAVRVADEKFCIRHVRSEVCQLTQPCERAIFHVGRHHVRHDRRLALHLLAALIDGVGIRQREERAAEQRQRQHDDACRKQKILPVDRAAAGLDLFERPALFLRFLFVFFRHTELLHFEFIPDAPDGLERPLVADCFSTFSRSLLTCTSTVRESPK